MLGKRARDNEAALSYQRAVYSNMPRGGAYANKRTRRSDTYLDRPLTSVPRARGAVVSGEMKYLDSRRTAVAISIVDGDWSNAVADPESTLDLGDGSSVANPACLCSPKVGAGISGRIGKNIKIMKVKIRWSIVVPQQQAQSLADDPPLCRIILALDKQTNASQMTGEELMANATTAEDTILSYQSVNNFGRFQVLKDRMVALQPLPLTYINTATLVQGGQVFHGKMNFSWRDGLQVRFNAGSTGKVADIIDNSLHVLAGVNNLLMGARLSYYSRVCYKE